MVFTDKEKKKEEFEEKLAAMSEPERHRVLTALKIKRVTHILGLTSLVVSVGAVFIKQKNGLTLAENALGVLTELSPQGHIDGLKPGSVEDLANTRQRTKDKWLGTGAIVATAYPTIHLAGWLTEKLYLNRINPEQTPPKR